MSLRTATATNGVVDFYEIILPKMTTIVRHIASTTESEREAVFVEMAVMHGVDHEWLLAEYEEWKKTEDYQRYLRGHSPLSSFNWPQQ